MAEQQTKADMQAQIDKLTAEKAELLIQAQAALDLLQDSHRRELATALNARIDALKARTEAPKP